MARMMPSRRSPGEWIPGGGLRVGLDPMPEMGDTTHNDPARPRDAARTSEDLRTWPR